MARRTREITIERAGRDRGKRFLITEMSADQGEQWALRAFLALNRSGASIPDEVSELGFAGILPYLEKGLRGLTYAEAKPLLDEMFECVQLVEPKITRRPTGDDIEEIATRAQLRIEVLKLHAGFSGGGNP